MIRLTRLDGTLFYANEQNIQWLESVPDTAVTFLGGARVIVREGLENVVELIRHELTRNTFTAGEQETHASTSVVSESPRVPLS